ncbi:2,5-didehydrogluconate reductase [Oceanicola granulosus HTCC2516]|uniref:2,5-didehydrogluconate reductase n=1 Tax=Oceanicola granulosus (strain ATCC BAA-861 / DSM 15982 / KCTC 12143 / HTCC2516) TaxID=314256 RepID=Q2CAL9_OCEGH|nr:aldo/keto reductase [Oceanicola granulosus]EAR49733.1 2,5-didehydrogluconate reductase [Oceanicola granulosus HTCC2516]
MELQRDAQPEIMPGLGFGTYGRQGEDGISAILCALETGYRHLDTAQDYDTEAEVGEAIRRAGLPREALFVTTKVRPANFGPGDLVPSVARSLETMGLDRADLVLIHWPAPNGERPLSDYIPQLAEARAQGLTRHVGVSNFPVALLTEARALLGDVPILTNQVELNPWFRNRTLADHCMGAGIRVTCYQPIAQGRLGGDPVIARIAARHGATPEQVALAWELAQGYAAIPTSSRPEHIRGNWQAQQLDLSPGELAEIDALNRGRRSIDPDWGPAWD